MRSQLAALFLVVSLSANAQTLSGTIDMHAHADPDGVARKLDAIDLARLAKASGMRGIVLKITTSPQRRLPISFARKCRESRFLAASRWI